MMKDTSLVIRHSLFVIRYFFSPVNAFQKLFSSIKRKGVWECRLEEKAPAFASA
jgi:hypothetical protein